MPPDRRVKLSTVLLLVALLAFGLAFYIQGRDARWREKRLEAKLMQLEREVQLSKVQGTSNAITIKRLEANVSRCYREGEAVIPEASGEP